MAMFFRIHFPGNILTSIMGPTTFVLVIGYVSIGQGFADEKSYLNGTFVQLTDTTWGFDVAWRRFVTVSIGITAAWLFSYRKCTD
jgi:hypothetical protein